MRKNRLIGLVAMAGMAWFSSCSTVEKASIHDFASGYYHLDSGKTTKKVYVDLAEEHNDIHRQSNSKPEKDAYLSIPLKNADSLQVPALRFRKQGLDVDITSALMKYRPSVDGLPGQLTTYLKVGFDNLLGRDRSIWIYNMKPWIGFIVGIALN